MPFVSEAQRSYLKREHPAVYERFIRDERRMGFQLAAPAEVAAVAKRAIALREEHRRGGTQVGITRANQLAKREVVSIDTIKRMVAYFDQMRAQLDPEKTVAETISPGSDYVELESGRKHVMSYLGDFLFPPRRANSPVRMLSGGERNRLLLARLFARPANVLVLYEPTNDLDIESLELLEAALQDYAGTLLLVSHDRAFLDNVVTQTIAAEGDGRWKEYAGGYADWRRAQDFKAQAKREEPRPAPAARVPAPQTVERKPAKQKLGYKEERELAALPDRIAALEQEQAAINQQLAEGAIYRNDPAKAQDLAKRLAELDTELTQLFERWEALESRAGPAAARVE